MSASAIVGRSPVSSELMEEVHSNGDYQGKLLRSTCLTLHFRLSKSINVIYKIEIEISSASEGLLRDA